MNPLKTLVLPAIVGAFLPPDNLPNTPLLDYQLGGVGLSNPTQGLQVQTWTLQVLGTGAGTYVSVSAPNTPATTLFSLPFLTWARLAFDQNMHPVVSYVSNDSPGFYWWDPTIPGNTFTALASTVSNPCVTMDDKRALQTVEGNNDVVLAYINNTNLCYRLQRERYNTEHVWYSNITDIIANPFVNKIGMASNYRLLLDIRGALYL